MFFKPKLFLIILILPALFFLLGCDAGNVIAVVDVSPGTATLAVGGTQQFIAMGRTSTGKLIDITPTWSTAGGIGSVSSSGLFTASSIGLGYVYATASNVVGSATVTVSDQGGVSGTVKNSDGTALSGITVSMVSYPSKSEITSSTGTYSITDITPGTQDIQAHGTILYLTSTQEVSIEEGKTKTINFTLGPRVSILSDTITQAGTLITINGQVRNNGYSTVTSVTVSYIFYDVDNNMIGTGSVSAGDLTTNETKAFIISLTLSESSYSRYTSSAAGTAY